MRGVGAALRHDVDVSAERAAKFGLAARCHHLELIDRVHAVRNAAQPGGIVVRRQSVDDEAVGEIALAANRKALPGNGGCLREQLRAADVGRRNTRDQQRQVEKIPAIEREALASACVTVAATWLRTVSRSGACPATVTLASSDATDSAMETSNADPTVRVTVRRASAKPSRWTMSLVRTHLQVRKTKPPSLVRDRFTDDIGVRLARRHVRAWHDGALWIDDATAQAAVIDRLLRERRPQPQEADDNQRCRPKTVAHSPTHSKTHC